MNYETEYTNLLIEVMALRRKLRAEEVKNVLAKLASKENKSFRLKTWKTSSTLNSALTIVANALTHWSKSFRTYWDTTMFEVIWSWSHDKYIIRAICAFSNMVPKLVGTEEECQAWANKHNS